VPDQKCNAQLKKKRKKKEVNNLKKLDPELQELLKKAEAFKYPELKHPEGMKSKGLGDTIAKVTSAIGIKPCGGCKKRQEILNKKFPYKK